MEKAGERIAGSRYFRAFCLKCGEPIRVSSPKGGAQCEGCSKTIVSHGTWANLTARQVEGLKKTGDYVKNRSFD